MSDDRSNSLVNAPTIPSTASGRRTFLKTAGVLVAAACAPSGDQQTAEKDGISPNAQRMTGFDGPLLASLGEAVLPTTLGPDGQRAAVAAFVTWCAAYEPVAEEMHGYGYADIRYLPPDPVPAWRAQLDGLDVLAQRVFHGKFASLSVTQRQTLVGMATRSARGDRLPSPLNASHVALALLGHWASTPQAWNRAFGVDVSPSTCRQLGDAVKTPVPLARART
jgi:hypothetical protein